MMTMRDFPPISVEPDMMEYGGLVTAKGLSRLFPLPSLLEGNDEAPGG